jgi:nucleoside-diphosphate-sugar epimerase
MRLFIFGCGYAGQAIVHAVRNGISSATPIWGTTREALGGHGVHVFDGASPGATLVADLRGATHVVLSIPPDGDGDPALRHHGADLDAAADLQWLCYYSTVGVYGDFDGGWVDESTPTEPRNDRSAWRLVVERQWQDYAAARGVPLLILRLAGIYGPGRSQFDKLRGGTARRIAKPGQVFNRIHVDDVGSITARAAEQRLAGTFNLADDEPAPPQQVVAYAADLLGLDPPPEIPFEAAEMTPMARSFYADNKRVSNAAIKRALGVELRYPTYREGLRAILEQTP